MIEFKQFLLEIANPPPGYILPTDRTKFSLGDIVLVIPTANWKTYQSKRSSNYFNKAGTVVGYKNVPGAYSKFAVEFSDGTVEPYHGHFLYGPFIDVKTAEKYDANTISNIDVKDIKGVDLGQEMQKNLQTENVIKNFFCDDPFNFKWLDTPIELSDSSSTITILALLPKSAFPETMRLLKKSNKLSAVNSANANAQFLKTNSNAEAEYKKIEQDNFIIFRFNNVRNKKLKKIPYTKALLNFELNNYSSSSYGMTFFTIYKSFDRSISSLKERLLKMFTEQVQLDVLHLNAPVIQQYAKEKPKIVQFLKLFDNDWDINSIIDFLYKVEVINGEKTIQAATSYYGRVELNRKNSQDLKDYVITVEVNYSISTDNENIILPKKITSDLTIQSVDQSPKKYTLTDFSFLQGGQFNQKVRVGYNTGYTGVISINNVNIPKIENFPNTIDSITITKCDLQNLYGLPAHLKYLNVTENKLNTLDGDVEKIDGTFIFSGNPIVKLGANSPTAGNYIQPSHMSDRDLEAAIKERDRAKFTSKETESEFSDLFNEL